MLKNINDFGVRSNSYQIWPWGWQLQQVGIKRPAVVLDVLEDVARKELLLFANKV